MVRLIDFIHVEKALNLPGFDSAQVRKRMSPIPRGWQKRDGAAKRAGVIILLYPDQDDRLNLVLTLRRADLRGHSGQVSFPGGRQEPEDATLVDTAIRETCEEIGVCLDRNTVVGSLPPFYIPTSHYDVLPTVAVSHASPRFKINCAEVEEVFSFALVDLLRPHFKCEETWRIGGRDVWVPYYSVKRHKVWGATAIMLAELEERLRQVLSRESLLELG